MSPFPQSARPVDAPDVRAAIAAAWSFAIDDGYRLYEFSIDSALAGTRDSADEWPPRYATWTALV